MSVNPFSKELNAPDNNLNLAITEHVIGNNFSQPWVFKLHTVCQLWLMFSVKGLMYCSY